MDKSMAPAALCKALRSKASRESTLYKALSDAGRGPPHPPGAPKGAPAGAPHSEPLEAPRQTSGGPTDPTEKGPPIKLLRSFCCACCVPCTHVLPPTGSLPAAAAVAVAATAACAAAASAAADKPPLKDPRRKFSSDVWASPCTPPVLPGSVVECPWECWGFRWCRYFAAAGASASAAVAAAAAAVAAACWTEV